MKIRTRSRSLSLLLVAVLGVAVPLVGTPRVAHAQTPVLVGVMDEDRLIENYADYKKAIEDLDALIQSYDGKLQAREFLNDDEGKKFDDFALRPTLTGNDQTALDALVKLGKGRREEFMTLVGTTTRTTEQTNRMKSLQDTMTKNGDAQRSISEKLATSLRKRQEDMDKTYSDKVNTVVARIAAEKKYNVILRKKTLVWSADSVDITDDVLKSLNKK